MKTKWNLFMVLALLVMLVGGNVVPAHAEEPALVLEQLPNLEGFSPAAGPSCGSGLCPGFADNFVVPENTTLTIGQVQLWGWYWLDDNSWPDPDDVATLIDDFRVILYADAEGVPGTPIYTEAHVNAQRVTTGVQQTDPTGSIDQYLFTLTLSTPPTLGAGAYWIEIYDALDGYLLMWETGDEDTLGYGAAGFAVWFPDASSGTGIWVYFATLADDPASPVANFALRLHASAGPSTYSISGTVFDDQNANGAYDTGEPGLSGVTIGAEKGCDWANVVTLTSGADGSYTFNDLEAGQAYCVDVLPPAGYKVTLWDLVIASLDADVTGRDFGLTNQALFTWAPSTPDEGGTATFAAVGGFAEHEWQITEPGVACKSDIWESPDAIGPTADLGFGRSGQYQVCLRMSNSMGYPVFDGQLVMVANAPPSMPYGLSVHPEPSTVGDTITVEVAYVDEDPVTCEIDYGDGTVEGGTILAGEPVCTGSHAYAVAGFYTIQVSLSDEAATTHATADHVVAVPAPDTPEVSPPFIAETANGTLAEPSLVGQEIVGVARTQFSDEGATCTVDYGDGTGAQPGVMGFGESGQVCVGSFHTYTAAGSYIVEAVVTNSNGKTGSNSAVHQVAAPAPAPVLSGISPASAVAGSADLSLVVSGSGFVGRSVVRWNGADLATTYAGESQLTAVIPAANLATAQTAQVTVYTPEPSGGTSDVLAFFVTEAPGGVTGQDVTSGDDPVATYGPATAEATGSGLLVVAEYDANPGGTPSFTVSGSYFDVYAAPDNTFTAVTITAYGLAPSEKLFWWDETLDKWVKAAPQSYQDGCVTLVVTDSSSPSLSQLQGTYFVAGSETTGENTAPIANPGGPYLAAINTAITFDGGDSADAEGDPLAYAWDLGDGSTGEGVTPVHTYIATGVYNVCLVVNDGALDSESACTLAVVYDPDGGFVTGGGWLMSPAGAYRLDESLSGKATFGFVSKYKKGASVPEGNTEFQFHAAGFSFRSTAYDWLVVSKDQVTAQFKGSGTVNGGLAPDGNAYRFMLWAGDGTPDTFRIKIWWEADGGENVVYDNGFNQATGGGNIVVHKK